MVNKELEYDANGYAIKEWAVESKDYDIFKVITKSYIAGATQSSTVKELERDVSELKAGIKWACDNPQSVFVFNELQKLITK